MDFVIIGLVQLVIIFSNIRILKLNRVANKHSINVFEYRMKILIVENVKLVIYCLHVAKHAQKINTFIPVATNVIKQILPVIL